MITFRSTSISIKHENVHWSYPLGRLVFYMMKERKKTSITERHLWDNLSLVLTISVFCNRYQTIPQLLSFTINDVRKIIEWRCLSNISRLKSGSSYLHSLKGMTSKEHFRISIHFWRDFFISMFASSWNNWSITCQSWWNFWRSYLPRWYFDTSKSSFIVTSYSSTEKRSFVIICSTQIYMFRTFISFMCYVQCRQWCSIYLQFHTETSTVTKMWTSIITKSTQFTSFQLKFADLSFFTPFLFECFDLIDVSVSSRSIYAFVSHSQPPSLSSWYGQLDLFPIFISPISSIFTQICNHTLLYPDICRRSQLRYFIQ